MNKSPLSALEIEALTFIYDDASAAQVDALEQMRRKWVGHTKSGPTGAVVALVVFAGLAVMQFLARTPPDTYGL
jgi:hypothetical protein